MAPKPIDTTNNPVFPTTTRAGFVKSCPFEMPLEEVIQLGKEAGLTIIPQDVHTARYYMRQNDKLVKLPPRASVETKKSDPPPPFPAGLPEISEGLKRVVNLRSKPVPVRQIGAIEPTVEEQFRRLIVRIGTVKAVALMADIEREIQDLAGN